RMFGDRYAVEARLGSGGMGIVYRATDRLLGRQVAIKVLRSEIAAMEVNGSSVLNEARAVATLNHPSIAAVHDLWESGGVGYIVMEYVRGCALWQLRLDGFQFTPEEGIAITHEVLDALEHAHESGVIHCDIKPGNVMLTPNGRVKVLDFGIASQMANPRAG